MKAGTQQRLHLLLLLHPLQMQMPASEYPRMYDDFSLWADMSEARAGKQRALERFVQHFAYVTLIFEVPLNLGHQPGSSCIMCCIDTKLGRYAGISRMMTFVTDSMLLWSWYSQPLLSSRIEKDRQAYE